MDKLSYEKRRIEKTHMREMFKQDAARFQKMSIQKDGLIFDYSKNQIDQKILSILIEVAQTQNVEQARNDMFNGGIINTTENKAALHTALRNRSDEPIILNGSDIMPDIKAVLTKMMHFANIVRDGSYQVTGGKITDVINIGIGGSDLGPRMVNQSLKEYHDGPKIHFVSNADESDFNDTIENLNPKTTLVIIASKSFTTLETMLNANMAKAWVSKAVGEKANKHFCAVSTNLEATCAFGIEAERTFGFWDWVGGRYSVWSAIGLSIPIAIGPSNFDKFLDGAYAADEHFFNTPLGENIPVIMALIGIWQRNVLGISTQAVIPYDNRMSSFPSWLQQLDMESNGKSTLKSNDMATLNSGPVIFGVTGTDGQHSFFQWLHQATSICPCDFLIGINGFGDAQNRNILLANCLAQTEALMMGGILDQSENNPHRIFPGNRPSNTLLYEELTPYMLGMLMAFYEHKVFVQGVIWDINSFDQWGVELSKELASGIHKMIKKGVTTNAENSSTNGLLQAVLKARKNSTH